MLQTGDAVLLRNVLQGKVWDAMAATVVLDDSELIAVYWAAGYPRKAAAATRGAMQQLWFRQDAFDYWDVPWIYTNVLCLTTPGAAHANWLVRKADDGEFLGWYVNLQAPLVRTRRGFDTADHELDVVIRPDFTWYWKDEDELAFVIEHGFMSPEEGKTIRAEGERVIEMALRRESPFGDGWEEWSPDPSWSRPQIPAGWDLV